MSAVFWRTIYHDLLELGFVKVEGCLLILIGLVWALALAAEIEI